MDDRLIRLRTPQPSDSNPKNFGPAGNKITHIYASAIFSVLGIGKIALPEQVTYEKTAPNQDRCHAWPRQFYRKNHRGPFRDRRRRFSTEFQPRHPGGPPEKLRYYPETGTQDRPTHRRIDGPAGPETADWHICRRPNHPEGRRHLSPRPEGRTRRPESRQAAA